MLLSHVEKMIWGKAWTRDNIAPDPAAMMCDIVGTSRHFTKDQNVCSENWLPVFHTTAPILSNPCPINPLRSHIQGFISWIAMGKKINGPRTNFWVGARILDARLHRSLESPTFWCMGLKSRRCLRDEVLFSESSRPCPPPSSEIRWLYSVEMDLLPASHLHCLKLVVMLWLW